MNGPNGRFSKKAVQGFIIPVTTREITSVFRPATGFGNPHDVTISRDGNDIYVVEISKPYRLWKFSENATTTPYLSSGRQAGSSNMQTSQLAAVALPHKEDAVENTGTKADSANDDSFGASVIIMAFLTIPLLLLIGIGALIRLRDSGNDAHIVSSFMKE